MGLRAVGIVLLIIGGLLGIAAVGLVPFALMAESGGKNSDVLLAVALVTTPVAMVALGIVLARYGSDAGRRPLSVAFRIAGGCFCVGLPSVMTSPGPGGVFSLLTGLVLGGAFWLRETRPEETAEPAQDGGR